MVRLRTGALEAEWPGRVARVSDRIDPQTRTVGVVVAVDRPYAIAARTRDDGIPARPALAKNMYVEVELRGMPQPGRVVIPRAAVHAGRVYVLNGEDRLELRKVSIAFEQEDVLVVGEGLRAGERIVVSDLIPAIAGMKLAPEADEATAAWLRAQAASDGQVAGSGATPGGRAMIRYFAGHPTAANLVMIAFLAIGALSVSSIKRETFPDIPPRNVEVRVVYPGASAEEGRGSHLPAYRGCRRERPRHFRDPLRRPRKPRHHHHRNGRGR